MNVYADNAATTRMSQAAVDAMLPFLRESYGNPSSLYTLGQKAAESLQASRETMAKYLGCDAREITFTSGSLDPSHVLLAIGRPHEVAHGSLRLTLCESNTEAEIDHILACVPEIVAYLRGMSPVWRDLVEGKKSFIL